MIPGHLMSSRGDKEVQLDERWRSDLSSKEINLFEKIGGSHNILYGYEKL